MREQKQVYDQILRDYPENISKEQFYKIAHISKATALYLLDSGKVPCIRSSKKTHRYIIRTEDVIEYMKDRERRPDDYKVPAKWRYHRPGTRERICSFENKLVGLTKKQREKLRRYFMEQMQDADDLLCVPKVSEAIGYSCSTIRRWCNTQGLKSLKVSGDFYIQKQYLAEFLSSEYACGVRKKSEKHSEMISGFLKTQNKG